MGEIAASQVGFYYRSNATGRIVPRRRGCLHLRHARDARVEFGRCPGTFSTSSGHTHFSQINYSITVQYTPSSPHTSTHPQLNHSSFGRLAFRRELSSTKTYEFQSPLRNHTFLYRLSDGGGSEQCRRFSRSLKYTVGLHFRSERYEPTDKQ